LRVERGQIQHWAAEFKSPASERKHGQSDGASFSKFKTRWQLFGPPGKKLTLEIPATATGLVKKPLKSTLFCLGIGSAK
jgi:hypothetical protein